MRGICGHIHKAEARTDGDVAYYNCGDWVESGTALVEHEDGTLQVIDGVAMVELLRASAGTPGGAGVRADGGGSIGEESMRLGARSGGC